MNNCRICGQIGDHPILPAREQMFASHKVFDYFCCLGCGCLQITHIPPDLAQHYPLDYYSYHSDQSSGWRALLRKTRNRGLLQHSLRGRLLNHIKPYDPLKALAKTPITRHSRILDLGCGQGQLVSALIELGFQHTRGIDPFLPTNQIEHPPYISRCNLNDLEPGWDLIMMHHSLEHLPDPRAVFHQVYQKLNPKGYFLLRVPTVDSWAYKHYGKHWVQWDAPRHLYLFSRKNLKTLAQEFQFKLVFMQDDSNEFQFLGSKAYGQNLPLTQLKSSRVQKVAYSLRAAFLNRQELGDQLICLLQKKIKNH